MGWRGFRPAARPHWSPVRSASPNRSWLGGCYSNTFGEYMRRVLQREITVLRHLALPALVLLLGTAQAFAQSGAQDQGKPAASNPADAAKENQRKTDQFVEAAQAINGPAGNPECVWLGRRVVQLIWVDDL